ncbi:MAG: SET domain-containing protein [Saprospiraceae bacterium]
MNHQTNKEKLLNELLHNSYVRLSPSAVHGIGVFAIKKIPKGCRNSFSDEEGEWELLSFKEVETMPQFAKDLIENFCLFDQQHYYVPAKGFKSIDLSLFLNHSDQPNVASIDDGRYFIAMREILPGEELFVDYGTLVD